jgi:hypothetical protein
MRIQNREAHSPQNIQYQTQFKLWEPKYRVQKDLTEHGRARRLRYLQQQEWIQPSY